MQLLGTREPSEIDRARCRPALYEALAQGERDLREMFRDSPSRIVPAGSVLIAPERARYGPYLLNRGWACRIREWPDGRRIIPEIYLPGDLIGLEAALRTRPTDQVVAIQPAMVQGLDGDTIAGLLARPATATYLGWLISEAQRRAEDRANRLARFGAQERLAEMLLDQHERLRRRELVTAGSFNLPLTQQQMAEYLGLTIVHVNRTLRLLREEKIAIIDRHVVIIRDMPRLRSLAMRPPVELGQPKTPLSVPAETSGGAASIDTGRREAPAWHVKRAGEPAGGAKEGGSQKAEFLGARPPRP